MAVSGSVAVEGPVEFPWVAWAESPVRSVPCIPRICTSLASSLLPVLAWEGLEQLKSYNRQALSAAGSACSDSGVTGLSLPQSLTKGGVTYRDEPWHKECFVCTGCKAPLAGQQFTSQEDNPYCVKCFGNLYAKKCSACAKPITGILGVWSAGPY